jgi:hypothetical protein
MQGTLAQKIFREGYVVKNSGESLTGLVEYSEKQDVPSACTFKRFDIAMTVVYYPGEIQAFGYRNGNRYESREINGTNCFLEVIVTGKIILYQKGQKYYIDKEHTGLIELRNGPIIYNSGQGNREFKSLPEFLTFVTEGKGGTLTGKFSVKNEIEPLITSYNKQSGNSYHVFNRSVSEKQLTQDAWKSGAVKSRFGIVSGVNIYMLNLKFNPNMSGINSSYFIPDPEKEYGLSAGITYERLLSRRTDRFSAKIGILYNKQSFYSYSERSNSSGGTTRDDAYFDFSGIKVPVLFQYSLTGGRFVPYVNAGMAYQYFIDTDYLHVAEAENAWHDITTWEDSNMLFKTGELTAAGGFGVRTRIFNNLNLHLMLMLEYGKGLFLNTDPSDTNSRVIDFYVQH